MLHACVERFDVMDGRGNILGWDGEVNKALVLVKVDVTCTQARKVHDSSNYWWCPTEIAGENEHMVCLD
jgi:hypothetical protein